MDIKPTESMGRGVFANKSYQEGDIIEICHVIKLNSKDRKKLDSTELYNYYFSWGKDDDEAAIALGNGSIYNHSYNPNAKYIKLMDEKIIEIIACQPIKSGSEIKVNYNGNPLSRKTVWFEL